MLARGSLVATALQPSNQKNFIDASSIRPQGYMDRPPHPMPACSARLTATTGTWHDYEVAQLCEKALDCKHDVTVDMVRSARREVMGDDGAICQERSSRYQTT